MTKTPIVFYAEDDTDDIELMQEMINHLRPEHKLVIAADGEDAVEKLKDLHANNNDPCVIILDGNMPKLTGEETVERIKESIGIRDVPVCIFSTSPADRFAQVAAKFQVKVYQKPASLKQLNKTVKELLNHCPH
jgi:CheY-like chemotaxis protein